MRNKWSYSSLSCYDKCAAQYRYRYIDNLPWPTSTTASRGTVKHKEIEAYLNGDLITLSPELNFYTSFLDGIKAHPRIYPEMQMAFNDKWEPVDWKDDTAYFRCIMDLLVETPERAHVYDWKTGKEYKDHEGQREIYAIASLCHYPDVKDAEATHVYLDQGFNRRTLYDRSLALDVLRPRWEERVSHMNRDTDYIPSPGFHCRYCPYSRTMNGPCRF